jgi:integrase/recombinase XerD
MQDQRRWRGPEGGLGPHREELGRELAALGYKPRTVTNQLELAGRLNGWLVKEGLTLGELTAAEIARFERFRRRAGAGHGTGLTPILEYLRRLGVVPALVAAVPAGPIEEVLERYRRYLVGERGVGESTVIHYTALARCFLVQRQRSHCDLELSNLDAAEVIKFVEKESRTRTVGYAKYLVTELRSLLRFLHREGLAGPLAEAVPTVAGWRGSLLPRGPSPRSRSAACSTAAIPTRLPGVVIERFSRYWLGSGCVSAKSPAWS